MIKPAGEMRGAGLDALVGDDVAGGVARGVGEPERVTSVEASGGGVFVSERDHVSSAPPLLLWLSHARKATSIARPTRTISRVFVRCRAAHLMTVGKNYPQITQICQKAEGRRQDGRKNC
jgi:hypothetical protein